MNGRSHCLHHFGAQRYVGGLQSTLVGNVETAGGHVHVFTLLALAKVGRFGREIEILTEREAELGGEDVEGVVEGVRRRHVWVFFQN